MPDDRRRSSRTDGALVAHRPDDSASPVERRMRVDPRTHTKSLYQRGPDGSEMYASYYNSNDDPTFQERFNRHNNGNAFVQSAQFTYVSHGCGGGRNPGVVKERQRPVVVEEPVGADKHEASTDSGNNANVYANHRDKEKRRTSKQDPIVEEPDGENDYNDADSRAHRRSGKKGERSSHPDALEFWRDPWGMESMMAEMMQPPLGFGDAFPFTSRRAPAQGRQKSPSASDESKWQLSPYSRGGVMGGPFTGDFFGTGGPESPFRMMEAMQYHMHKQRAAMFGGVDPFARFM
ncbi:protein of unknown function - conserved [Leishmania donovani]|uniref:Hypothetical_protein_conserved n=1 Tax=Leishmania donovani TaxID=5661 RepID=A0A3S5H670_LEIDO|nr:hypothetical protein, unknown function [Leishmania donovani]AYU76385.1 hypothetical protein LdCL_080013300 [Leishmania donovani]TPP49062.1 hypothetical protein CGC21_0175 [Leishmania donovani]TPP54939.1 hypothetical protein CGC20_23035 [Leishmania donovani]CAJ1986452.1 protein of unknown function - conserved [Leishmania donovani]CBZ31921.1 hypothetical protein, unknown function [Leishmania donovani]